MLAMIRPVGIQSAAALYARWKWRDSSFNRVCTASGKMLHIEKKRVDVRALPRDAVAAQLSAESPSRVSWSCGIANASRRVDQPQCRHADVGAGHVVAFAIGHWRRDEAGLRAWQSPMTTTKERFKEGGGRFCRRRSPNETFSQLGGRGTS